MTQLLLVVALLVGTAVGLAGPAPRIMASRTSFRRAAGPALFVWQAVATAAVLSALLAGPVALLLLSRADGGLPGHVVAAVGALAVSASVLVLLLRSGHRIGRHLRVERRVHRHLVDLLATHGADGVRVLEHPTPTAYCLPGVRRRVVLTRGTLDALAPAELEAVLAHERAHLRTRHDLVLEFFTVVHEAMPGRLASPAALREVRLLIEVLADRAAVRAVGEVAVARALVALAGASHPSSTLGGGDQLAVARVRIDLLDRRTSAVRVAAMLTLGVLVLAVPTALAALATLAWRAGP